MRYIGACILYTVVISITIFMTAALLLITLIRMSIGYKDNRSYFMNAGQGYSVFLNSLRGENWHRPICATEWKRQQEGKINVVRLLDMCLGDNHCLLSSASYKIRRERVSEGDNWRGQYAKKRES